jgi:hypothetical protein
MAQRLTIEPMIPGHPLLHPPAEAHTPARNTSSVLTSASIEASQIVGDRDWLTFNSAVLQFSEAFDKLRWMNRFCQ